MTKVIRLALSLFSGLFLISGSSHADETSCATFLRVYSEAARSVFAFGYLEGVQGALTKEIADILVPVSHPDHPLWWVVPKGGSSIEQFRDGLEQSCQKRPTSNVLKAILATALRKGGWPAFGAFVDPSTGKLAAGPERPNANILGDAKLKCREYIQMHEVNREALITGYFIGTEAFRLVMAHLTKKPDPIWLAWPLGMSSVTMRRGVDEICKDPKERDASIRDILWVRTIELSAKQQKNQ